MSRTIVRSGAASLKMVVRLARDEQRNERSPIVSQEMFETIESSCRNNHKTFRSPHRLGGKGRGEEVKENNARKTSKIGYRALPLA